jgi:signal transduction histidine kinase
MRRTYYHNEEQQLFNNSLSALRIAARSCIMLFVYSPLLLIGFALSSFLWGTGNQVLLLFLFTGIFALLLFGMIYFLKGLLIGCRNKKSLWWLPLWILCVGLTCIFPVWLAYDAIQFIAVRISATNTGMVTKLLAVILGIYIYSFYTFHKDKCPSIAISCYKIGKELISR